MTYGQVRLRLAQLLPGIELDLLDGWIADRYQQILDRLAWQRRDVQSIVQTAAPVTEGTILLTKGSAAVTGSGTGWTSAITGSGLYVPGRNEFYEVTYVSGTQLTLDRPYEGETGTGSAYKLFQQVYPLPADCRILKSVRSLQYGPLKYWDASKEIAGTVFGAPRTYRPFMDTASDPPRQQIEVWPVPDGVYSLAIEYTAEETAFDGSSTETALLPWVRPGALTAGVYADGLNHLEKHAAADRQELKFESLVGDMVRTEAKRTPAKTIRLAAQYTVSHGRSLYRQRQSQMP